MKKGLGVFAAVLLLAAVIPQPAAADVTFDLGVKGGISLAKVKTSDEIFDWCNLMKPVLGVFFSLNLNEQFSVQPEIYLLKQGGKYEEEIEGDTYKLIWLFDYIHIPVLAKVKLASDGEVKPIIFAGPAFGYLVRARQKYYENGTLMDDEDVMEFLKKPNISAVFGGGVEIILEKLLLILEVRYDLGLVNVLDDPDDSVNTNALMIMAGLGF